MSSEPQTQNPPPNPPPNPPDDPPQNSASESPQPAPWSLGWPSVGQQVALVSVVLVGLGAYSVGFAGGVAKSKAEAQAEAQAASAKAQAPVQAVLVKAHRVKSWPRTDSYQEIGTIHAAKRVTLSAELPGTVLSVTGDLGDTVTDTVGVVKLDAERREWALASAQARVKQLSLEIDLARKQLGRLQTLAARKSVSTERVDQLETRLESLGVDKELAQLAVSMARKDLQAMVLKGPVGLGIVARHCEVGELLAAGQPIFEFADLRSVKVSLRVPPRRLSFVRALMKEQYLPESGAELWIEVDSLGEAGEALKLPVKMARIAPAVESSSRRFLVEFEAKNPEALLADGLAARVVLKRVLKGQEVVVPRESVVRLKGAPVVYELTAQGRAKPRGVEVLAERGESMVSVRGLPVGLEIARGGASLLTPEAAFKVVE